MSSSPWQTIRHRAAVKGSKPTQCHSSRAHIRLSVQGIVFVLSVYSLASCGLIAGVRLVAPPEIVSRLLNEVTFRHVVPQNAFPGFQGYELYYRIFGINQDDEIAADRQAVEASTDPFSVLTSRGFRRFQVQGSTSRPLVIARVRNPVSENVTFEFDFSNAIGAGATEDPVLRILRDDAETEEFVLLRTILPDSSDFGSEASKRSFINTSQPQYRFPDDGPPHADVHPDYDGSSDVLILVFAIGQAFDIERLSNVRSIRAVELIEIQ